MGPDSIMGKAIVVLDPYRNGDNQFLSERPVGCFVQKIPCEKVTAGFLFALSGD